jgi:hypothetical protein
MQNEKSRSVIDSYLDPEKLAVPHAILVSGPWGSGKTHYIEKVYEPERKRRIENSGGKHTPFLFVSLFGVKSVIEVKREIFTRLNPSMKKLGKTAHLLLSGSGEFLRMGNTVKQFQEDISNKALDNIGINNVVFVFDDLERADSAALPEILGFVNSLVSECERRVIILADEERLRENNAAFWQEQNEKVIGRRVEIEPEFDTAISAAITRIGNESVKSFFADRLEKISYIAGISGVKNLRSLLWAIDCSSQFVSCLIADEDIPAAYTERAMLMVIASSLWLRSGRIAPNTLEKVTQVSHERLIRRIRSKDSEPRDFDKAAEAFFDTFVSLDPGAPPVEYSRIVNFEQSSLLKIEEMLRWVKSQNGFGEAYSEPSWRILWHAHNRSIKDIKSAISGFENDFESRRFSSMGEILHCAGVAIKLRISPRKEGYSSEELVGRFKIYIDDLVSQNRLDPLTINGSINIPDEFGGMGFAARETEEFKEVCKYLFEAASKTAMDRSKGDVERIISEAEGGNLDALKELLGDTSPNLSQNSVMIYIDAERFSRLMLVDQPNISAGAEFLAFRYFNMRDQSPLCDEIPWAREVYRRVIDGLQTWDEPFATLARSRLDGAIHHYEKDRAPALRIIRPNEEEGSTDTAQE